MLILGQALAGTPAAADMTGSDLARWPTEARLLREHELRNPASRGFERVASIEREDGSVWEQYRRDSLDGLAPEWFARVVSEGRVTAAAGCSDSTGSSLLHCLSPPYCGCPPRPAPGASTCPGKAFPPTEIVVEILVNRTVPAGFRASSCDAASKSVAGLGAQIPGLTLRTEPCTEIDVQEPEHGDCLLALLRILHEPDDHLTLILVAGKPGLKGWRGRTPNSSPCLRACGVALVDYDWQGQETHLAAHEIGHLLGGEHGWAQPGTLMGFPVGPSGTLSADNLCAMQNAIAGCFAP